MRGYRAVVACVMVLALMLPLAGCATVSTTTQESQSKQRDPRLARLYFIWPQSAMFKVATLDIKVNGQVVGKIAPDSYFFIDRQPGTYTVSIEPPFDFSYFTADARVGAGGTYYFAVNVKPVAVGLSGGGYMRMEHPQHGTPMEAKSGSGAQYTLKTLDAGAATAEMAKLTDRGNSGQ